MPKLNFSPKQNGFRFINYFTNVVANLPGIGQITNYGRCGGMCYTVLDHWHANLPTPPQTAQDFADTDGVPPDGHPLADYIYQRQLDSVMTLSAIKLITLTLAPDKPTWFTKGVSRLSKEDEWAKLKTNIDAGKPTTIGLILARSLSDMGHNHQVLAYGYDEDASTQTIYIYDVNFANRELKLVSAHAENVWHEDDKLLGIATQWRGWFVQDYSPKRPPENLNVLHVGAKTARAVTSKKQASVQLSVTLKRITFNNENDGDMTDDVALEFDIGGQAWRYPSKGTKTVDEGRSYRLNKTFRVALPNTGELVIAAHPAYSDEHLAAVHAGLLENADLQLDDAAPGLIRQSHTAQNGWGKGEHTARSSGSAGVYALVYEISEVR